MKVKMKVRTVWLTGHSQESVKPYVLKKLAPYLKGKENEVRVYWKVDPKYPSQGEGFYIRGRTARSVLLVAGLLHSLIDEWYSKAERWI